MGGATGAIGDPSGRSTERPILSPSKLQENVSSITEQVYRFFTRGTQYIETRGGYPSALSGKNVDQGVRVLNNQDWFKDFSFLDFLRDVGKFARVNVMLTRDSYVLPFLIPGLSGGLTSAVLEQGEVSIEY